MSKRAELRREARRKDPVYTLTASQIQEIKDEATNESLETAFFLMLGIPVMIIHDKFGQLMRKAGREERFVDLALDLWDSYLKGYITLDDIIQTLKDEVGVEDVREKRKKRY